jgi:uracil-DNA glycosylase
MNIQYVNNITEAQDEKIQGEQPQTTNIKIYNGLYEVLEEGLTDKERSKYRWHVLSSEKISDQWTILDIVDKKPPLNWITFFESIRESELADKDETIDACVCFPLKKHIFQAFDYVSLDSLKLVMVGMDPYPQYTDYGEPRANGLCFSVDKRDIIPKSLMNIYNELKNTFPNFIMPTHGDLTGWAKQGILMLNASLTVEYDKPESHSKDRMWEGFLIELIRYIDKNKDKGIVYALFGNYAKNLKDSISDKNKVILSGHPVARDPKLFFGHNTFLKINQALYNLDYMAIDWNVY